MRPADCLFGKCKDAVGCGRLISTTTILGLVSNIKRRFLHVLLVILHSTWLTASSGFERN